MVGIQLTSLAPGSLQLVARLLGEEEYTLPSLFCHILLIPPHPSPALDEDFVKTLQTVSRKPLSEEFCQNYYHQQMSSPGGTPQSSTGRTSISGVVNYPWEVRTGCTWTWSRKSSSRVFHGSQKNNQLVQELVVVQSSQNSVGAFTSPKTLRKKVARNIFLKNGFIETL